ncbi:MAG: argininosuccinate lyase [Candidatus Omnitrophica bacterium]|nr:argininosuccinate lyase [Candidatus Omnitrophota bacterium]
MRKLWGGRFVKRTDPLVERYTSSIAVDHRLAKYDVLGSIAHATMLGRCRIIPRREAGRLVTGLKAILRAIEEGRFRWDPSAEDIHTQIQAELAKRVGSTADLLHTARSRNDQVALDLRLYCRDAVGQLRDGVAQAQRALVELAAREDDVIIPGYTHLQRAQPILLAHHLLAYVEMLERDQERLADALKRINVLPLGAGALAGTSLPINRFKVATLLGFDRVSDNSIDAVSDRDFVAELLADLALVAVHLSRLAEDVILWATEEFGILSLDDAVATGSSLMPQKKNPDALELIRGQTGQAFGGLVSLLTVLKGLPLSYNRDLQWDKAALFGVVDGVGEALRVCERLLRHVRIRRARAQQLLAVDTICATDLAEHLVQRGVAFRQAHEIVGRLVRACEREGRRLRDFSLAELRRYDAHFDESARRRLDPRRSVELKRSWGSTNPRLVRQMIARWKARLKK